jgi:hypothetical protein
MIVSLRRTVGSAVGMLVVAGAVGLGGSAFAGPVEDAQLLSAVNGVRVAGGAPALVSDAAAAAAAADSLTAVLAGGSVLGPTELSAVVGPSSAVTAFALTGADVYEAADLGFSDPTTGAALRDPAYTGAGIASDYSAGGDFVAVVVLRTPAAPEPIATEPAPAPSETGPTPEPSSPAEPTAAPTSPAPSPLPASAAPTPAGQPTADRLDRWRTHAEQKTEHFGKFSGDKLDRKLEKVATWLERKTGR